MTRSYLTEKTSAILVFCAALLVSTLMLNQTKVLAQSFTGLNSPYCSNNAPVTLTGSQAPVGIFSGPGITDNGNGTATFNPATAGTGGTIAYGSLPWASVTAGTHYTLAIKTDGTLWAWGNNSNGQLGIGNTTNQTVPVQVGTATNWASVRAGNAHSLAIKTDGTLWAWGFNGYGQLGIGNTTDQNSPVQIGSSTNWASVEGGSYHTLARKTDGTLWAWGSNGYGELGIGNTAQQNSPVQVGSGTNWASVTVASYYSLARKTDGTLWAWGRNDYGQLGIGNNNQPNSPIQVGIGTGWASVDAGDTHTLAIKTDGTLWAWGQNNIGQLGIGNTTDKLNPTQVGIGTNWASFMAGTNYTLAIKTDGTLWAWGDNTQGQLGIGNTTDQSNPIQVGTGTNWASVAAGYYSSLARKTDGTLWAWGRNNIGQLGIGNTTNQTSPVQVGSSFNTASQTVVVNIVSAGLSNNGPLSCGTPSVTLTATGVGTYVYSGGSATKSLPGTYTVTVTSSANGCTATATTEVTGVTAVLATPTGTITSTLCEQGGALTGSAATDATPLGADYARSYLLVGATGVIWDRAASVAALIAPVNTSSTDRVYTVHSLVYNNTNLNDVNITNGVTKITLGDANVITDYDGGDALQATPTNAACMALSAAAATTVTVGKKLDFDYDNFFVCGNTAANIDLFSPIAGLQVTWTASSAGGVTGFTNQASPVAVNGLGSFDITDVLSNASASPATVVYVITPQLSACSGASVTITQTVYPNLGIAVTPTTCVGTAYSAAFTITGGSGTFAITNSAGTLSYTPDAATGTVSGIPSGALYLTLEDVANCTALASTTLTIPTAPVVSPAMGTLGCINNSFNLTASGGTYVWSTAATTASITANAVGTYTVTVTAANGCIATATSVLNGSTSSPSPIASNTGPVCQGSNVGMTVAPNLAGVPVLSYAWAGPAGTATIQSPTILGMTPAKTGNYTVTVTYSNDCVATATTVLALNPKPVINSVSTVCVSGAGNVTVNATGSGLTYNIGTGAQAGNVFTGLAGATYTVTVTNSLGCTSTSSLTVNCVACPTISASNNSPVCIGANIELRVTPNLPGGVTATYLWNGPAGTATLQNPNVTNASPLKAGGYTVTVTYSNSCTATASTMVTLAPAIVGSIVGPTSICNGGSAVLTANGGATYVWSTSATTPAITVTTAGTYVVTITNVLACKRVSRTLSSVVCKDDDDIAQMQQDLVVIPNPFAGRATIEFMTSSTGHTSINVYSIEGKQVATLYNASTQAGEIYQVTLDGANLSNGLYFVEMTNANGEKTLVKAMLDN